MTFPIDFGAARPVDVYFDQLDVFRTLNHPHFLTLLDRAVLAYWESKGYHNDGDLDAPDTLQFVRDIAITYDRPIRDYGPVVVHFWVERIGTTSYTIGFRFASPEGTEEYAHGSRVMVKIDPATMRPAPWTERALRDFRELLRPQPAKV